MPACSLPKIPYFRDWYNREFKDLCEAHDAEYQKGVCRKTADTHFMVGIAYRGYPWLACLSFCAVRVFGRCHYARQKYNNHHLNQKHL